MEALKSGTDTPGTATPNSEVDATCKSCRRLSSEGIVKLPLGSKPLCWERLVTVNSCLPLHSCYVVKTKIGEGTWGSVHLAEERASGLERAIKKIPKRFTNELHRFRQEITFLKSLDHPNIIRFYESFEDHANIYLVTEYCKGGELFDRLLEMKVVNERDAASLIRQMLSALCYCHSRNICHRDLKPENFLFMSKDAQSIIKLIDFGLAKRFTSSRKMHTRAGTLYYVSPEVLRGSYNHMCDVWSIGVIMYLLLAGSPPFNGVTDGAIVNQINNRKLNFQPDVWDLLHPEAKELCDHMLAWHPDQRPSAEEALRHPWFKKFSKSFIATLSVPRPISVPGDLASMTARGSYTRQLTHRGASRLGSNVLRNLASNLVPKWRRFAQHNQLKRAALAVIAHHMSGSDEVRLLRDVFVAMDSSGDGALSSEEVKHTMKALEVVREEVASTTSEGGTSESAMTAAMRRADLSCPDFSRMDQAAMRCHSCAPRKRVVSLYPPSSSFGSDPRKVGETSPNDYTAEEGAEANVASGIKLYESGQVRYSEFLAASIDRAQYLSEPFCRAAFRVFDRDRDGVISRGELRAALNWNTPASISGSFDSPSSDTELDDLISIADFDGDGVIGYDDFVQLLGQDASSTKYLFSLDLEELHLSGTSTEFESSAPAAEPQDVKPKEDRPITSGYPPMRTPAPPTPTVTIMEDVWDFFGV